MISSLANIRRLGPMGGTLIEGHVIKRNPATRQDQQLQRNSYVSYDVKPLYPNVPIIRGCELAVGVQHYEGGDEIVLRPPSRIVSGESTEFDLLKTDMNTTDADRVLVGFIEGHVTRPVITHVLPHKGATWTTSRDEIPLDGEQLHQRVMNGTKMKTDRLGNWELDLQSGTIPPMPAEEKTATIKIGETTEVVVSSGNVVVKFGDVPALSVSADKIKVHGVEVAAVGNAVKADNSTDPQFFAVLTATLTALQAGAWTPNPAAPAALAAFNAAVSAAGGIPSSLKSKITEGSSSFLP